MLSGFKVAGWASYSPEKSLTSVEMDHLHGHASGWTEREFGIASRHVASEHETTSFMAASAAQDALVMTGWDEAAFDVIIGGCGVMEQPIPSTSALVQDKLELGNSGIPCFDVNQTCLSFVTALDMAAMGIAIGRWKRALVFASDIATAGLNPENAKIRSIFGDGAAAIAIEADPEGQKGLLSQASVTMGAHNALAQLRSGGTKLRVSEGYDALIEGSYFEMDAFGIFKAAAKALPGVIDAALTEASLTKDDLDCVICHQASAPGVEHVKRLFAPGADRVLNIFPTHGNQIAASIPTVLAHALTNGAVKRGDTLLLLGTAAGISASAMVIQI
ncbi:MAG: 3-oxoacyl-[acyl-carrier-protein] synthase III C-terminal domain-containing protein [Pseudomonadota bacterium]